MTEELKFKTSSGTEYILKDVELQIDATGEDCPAVGPQGIPVVVTYTGKLARVGSPLRDLSTGGYLDTATDSFHSVTFASMPTVGDRFVYYHELWAGCFSTPVSEINAE